MRKGRKRLYRGLSQIYICETSQGSQVCVYTDITLTEDYGGQDIGAGHESDNDGAAYDSEN